MKTALSVSEQFLSIQGEGITVGVPAYFLRLRSCNLLCGGKGTEKDKQLHDGAKWRCDTIEVWLKGTEKSFDEIVKDFGGFMFLDNLNRRTHHLVITGGEPLLHEEAFTAFAAHVYAKITGSPFVEVETNGTISPDKISTSFVSQWNVSPKLSNSGMPSEKRVNELAIENFLSTGKSIFKFVVANHADLMEVIKYWVKPYGIPKEKVLLMPAGDSRETLESVSQLVANFCANEGYRFSPRLHINIWNQKTGV
jgi:7-carboxy-7-deazaguanine synthase